MTDLFDKIFLSMNHYINTREDLGTFLVRKSEDSSTQQSVLISLECQGITAVRIHSRARCWTLQPFRTMSLQGSAHRFHLVKLPGNTLSTREHWHSALAVAKLWSILFVNSL